MQIREKSKKRININITSLIDVLFLLLIFFLVSSTFVEQPGMKIDLPKASKRESFRAKGYTLFISKDGSMFLNDEKIEMKDLKARLTAIKKDLGDKGLILKADEKTSYGIVIEVMDIVKQSDIKKLVVATEIKEQINQNR